MLTEKDLQAFMNLRKDFTDALNTYINNTNTEDILLEDMEADLKQFLLDNLSNKYRMQVSIYNLGDTVLLDTEIYSKEYGINVFPHITKHLEITLDKDFYGYVEADKELYSFSSIYEIEEKLKELVA